MLTSIIAGSLLTIGSQLLPSLAAQQPGAAAPAAQTAQRGARGAGRGAAETPPPRDSKGRVDLSGMWAFGGGQRGEPPPYTPEAQQQVREFQSRQNIDDPDGLCLLSGIPRIYSMPMPFKIIQQPNEIVFIHEAFRGIRIVPTDGRDHPADMEPSYMGDSVGHWEGDTLVVDVRGFNDRTWLGFGAMHHSDKMQVTERITRTSAESISYEALITDPGVFTKPWTVRATFVARPNERIREYACEENNQEVVKFQELLKKPEVFIDQRRLQQKQ